MLCIQLVWLQFWISILKHSNIFWNIQFWIFFKNILRSLRNHDTLILMVLFLLNCFADVWTGLPGALCLHIQWWSFWHDWHLGLHILLWPAECQHLPALCRYEPPAIVSVISMLYEIAFCWLTPNWQFPQINQRNQSLRMTSRFKIIHLRWYSRAI